MICTDINTSLILGIASMCYVFNLGLFSEFARKTGKFFILTNINLKISGNCVIQALISGDFFIGIGNLYNTQCL